MWFSKLLRSIRRTSSESSRSHPHFSVSVRLREAPDLVCSLTVSNPGPPFKLRSARLVRPRQGLIYSRDLITSDRLERFGFRELQLDHEVPSGTTLEIPFEVWIPSSSNANPIELSVRTTRRFRRYRCGP